MTVQSMHEVLNKFAVQYLKVVVPDNVDAVVNVAVVTAPDYCEEGHHHGFVSVAQIDLWCRFRVGKKRFTEVSIADQIPLWLVKDGDPEPVEDVLRGLWEQAQFMVLVKDAMPVLQKAYAEDGPFLVSEHEEHLDDEG